VNGDGVTMKQAGFKNDCCLFRNFDFCKKSPASEDAGLFLIISQKVELREN
jgi:hypothetical protein